MILQLGWEPPGDKNEKREETFGANKVYLMPVTIRGKRPGKAALATKGDELHSSGPWSCFIASQPTLDHPNLIRPHGERDTPRINLRTTTN